MCTCTNLFCRSSTTVFFFYLVILLIIDPFNTAIPIPITTSCLPPLLSLPSLPTSPSHSVRTTARCADTFPTCILSRAQGKQPLAWHFQIHFCNLYFDAVGVQVNMGRCDVRWRTTRWDPAVVSNQQTQATKKKRVNFPR